MRAESSLCLRTDGVVFVDRTTIVDGVGRDIVKRSEQESVLVARSLRLGFD